MRLPRLTLFWRIQLTGWLLFAVATFPLKLFAFQTVGVALAITLTREPLGLLFSTGLRWIYRRLRDPDARNPRIAILIVALSIAAGALDVLLGRSIGALMGQPEAFVVSVGVFGFRSTLYVVWSLLYFGLKAQRAAQRRQLNLARAETALREAELQLLRAQVNPHFLFNALNTILATLEPQHTAPKRVVEGLAGYLRYSLTHRHDALVPLGDEFDAALSYLAVEQARFRDELLVESSLAADARSILVPGVILQPLIENAVKYSRATSEPPYRINLDVATAPDGRVRLEVANTGTWVEPSTTPGPHGTGLENLRRRLALLYPGRHRLDISATDGWVRVQLHLQPVAASGLAPAAIAART